MANRFSREPSPGMAACTVCGRVFGGVGGFDQHRNHRDDDTLTERDRCIDPATLGMVERDGVWRTPMTEADRDRMARLGVQVTPQSDEQTSGDHPGTPDVPEVK